MDIFYGGKNVWAKKHEVMMKFPFFKALLLSSALVIAWNCTGDDILKPNPGNEANASIPCWLFTSDANYLIIQTEEGFIVNTTTGVTVGIYDPQTGIIYDANANPTVTGLDLGILPVVNLNSDGSITDQNGNVVVPTPVNPPSSAVIASSATIPVVSSSSVVTPASSATVPQPKSSAQEKSSSSEAKSSATEQPKSSSSEQRPQCGDQQCYDAPSAKCVGKNNEQTGPKGEKYAYDNSCALKCYYDPDNKECKNLGASTNPKSSSSAKSSSSVQSSSSGQLTGGCPNIKTTGGKSGSGWATRYWDCCKPHCSGATNTSYHSKQCTNKGKTESTDWGAGSVCSGGNMMACTSPIPFTIDGCDEYGFAFAAVPAADGGSCGKCFQLTFTGEGHYNSTNANTKKLKGKKLIIMTTNIGGDVQQGQFDIMIPGGGVGMFNGCSSMGWGAQGEQYGGLLSDCEKESNYNAGTYAKCLTEKCNKAFSNDEQAKKGCMFLVDWMQSAGNPEHNYVEVECPQVLKDRY